MAFTSVGAGKGVLVIIKSEGIPKKSTEQNSWHLIIKALHEQ